MATLIPSNLETIEDGGAGRTIFNDNMALLNGLWGLVGAEFIIEELGTGDGTETEFSLSANLFYDLPHFVFINNVLAIPPPISVAQYSLDGYPDERTGITFNSPPLTGQVVWILYKKV